MTNALRKPYEGDESAAGQPLERPMTDAAHSVMAPLINGMVQSDANADPSAAVYHQSLANYDGWWNGTAPGENIRPDLISSKATLEVKASINQVANAVGHLSNSSSAVQFAYRQTCEPNVNGSAATLRKLANKDIVVCNRDGASPSWTQVAISQLVQVIVQMRTHHRIYGILIDWEQAVLIRQTGPRTYAISPCFVRDPRGNSQKHNLLSLLCAAMIPPTGTENIPTGTRTRRLSSRACKSCAASAPTPPEGAHPRQHPLPQGLQVRDRISTPGMGHPYRALHIGQIFPHHHPF